MQARRMVALDNETMLRLLVDLGRRLGRCLEAAFSLVLVERHGGYCNADGFSRVGGRGVCICTSVVSHRPLREHSHDGQSYTVPGSSGAIHESAFSNCKAAGGRTLFSFFFFLSYGSRTAGVSKCAS